jgi:ATP-dependent RNA helicase DDX47/RRP3
LLRRVLLCACVSAPACAHTQYLFIPAKYKDCYLAFVLNEFAGNSMIVFTATCNNTQKCTLMLRNLGFQAVCLHGQMSQVGRTEGAGGAGEARCGSAGGLIHARARSPQTKRLGALNKFKSGARTILLATDVASRGLDIPAVDVVINYDTPSTAKDYVHRCAAAAAAGCARALSRRRPAP